jgi:hypothetical protein
VSVKVQKRLSLLNLLEQTNHDIRMEIDKELESQFGGYCDDVIDRVTDDQLREVVRTVLERRKKKRGQQFEQTGEMETIEVGETAYA